MSYAEARAKGWKGDGGHTSAGRSAATSHGGAQGTTGKANAWNAFQHEHRAQGWSRERMQAEYHAHQAKASAPPRRPQPAAAPPRPVGSSGGGGGSGSKNNPWNAFQAAHRGQGLTRSQMVAAYRAGGSGAAGSGSAGPSGGARASGGGMSTNHQQRGSPTPMPTNPWNAFLHQHQGQGYSRPELSRMYHSSGGGASSSSVSSAACYGHGSYGGGGASSYSGSACYSVSSNPTGPMKKDGTPDMRYAANRR